MREIRRAPSRTFGGSGDRIAEGSVLAVSAVCILVLGFILFFLVWESLPVLRQVHLKELLFDMDCPQEEPPVLGMGATRWQTIWRAILPSVSPAVLSGMVRACSESGTGMSWTAS